MNFDWSVLPQTLGEFGGSPITLHIPKTGLPYFDALRLYGAIDLYVGLREDISIHDAGKEWRVEGRSRAVRLRGRDERILTQIRKGSLKPKPRRDFVERAYCQALRSRLLSSKEEQAFQDSLHEANGPFAGFDSAIQSGIRGVAAASYDTLQSGQSSDEVCIAHIPLSDGLLAFAGYKRSETIGDILFLPLFEGRIDLSKVVSPLRAWLASPNPLCAQALMILGLKTSLFVEGFQERLSAVVYNKRVKQGDFAFSGVVSIASTAVGKIKSPEFAADTYRVFRQLIVRGWKNGKTTDLAFYAIAMANWLLQPSRKNLSTMVTSQERLYRDGQPHIFIHSDYVKEAFTMSCGDWQGDYEAVRKFAKAVASGIFFARMAGREFKERQKAWYDEITMLRSAPSQKSFVQRAMILVEQGHAEHSEVGTSHRGEAFDPKALCDSIGKDRNDFESFRDLFRMYLVQESKYIKKDEPTVDENVQTRGVPEGHPEGEEEEQ